jgi:hypothetical protein
LGLKGDIKGKPNIVNGQYLKNYLVAQNFVGNVEEVSDTFPVEYVKHQTNSPVRSQKSIKRNFSICKFVKIARNLCKVIVYGNNEGT